jgi:hypothetical protein
MNWANPKPQWLDDGIYTVQHGISNQWKRITAIPKTVDNWYTDKVTKGKQGIVHQWRQVQQFSKATDDKYTNAVNSCKTSVSNFINRLGRTGSP